MDDAARDSAGEAERISDSNNKRSGGEPVRITKDGGRGVERGYGKDGEIAPWIAFRRRSRKRLPFPRFDAYVFSGNHVSVGNDSFARQNDARPAAAAARDSDGGSAKQFYDAAGHGNGHSSSLNARGDLHIRRSGR